jgi:hypothetical protein
MAVTGRALLASILLVGCAPSAQSLVDHHYAREELCAIGSASAEDEKILREGLERDLAPRVEVTRFDVGESDFHAVRLRVATNAMPIDELRIQPSSKSDDVVLWDLPSLAKLTHETLPGSRTVRPGALAELGVFMVAVFTVGLVRLELPRPHTEYPSADENRRAAPRASELSRLLANECTRPEANGVAARCTFAFAVRTAAKSPDITLDFELEARPDHRDGCGMHKISRIALDASSEGFRQIP